MPFVWVFCLRRVGWRRAVLGGAVMLAVAALIIVPFVLSSPSGFKHGLWDHWVKLSSHTYRWALLWIRNVGFSFHFYKGGHQGLLVYIQVLICLGAFGLFVWRRGYERLSTTLSYCALTTFFFLMFNVVVWTYLYQPVLLLTICATFAAASASDRAPSPVLR
jgi:hypothetical protein